jgi:hypothetical protein
MQRKIDMKIQHAFYQPHRDMTIEEYIRRASSKKYWRHVVTLLGVMAGAMMTVAIAAAQSPTNDDIENATLVTELPFAVGPIDTSEATAAVDDPQDCYSNGSNWYTFTPTDDISIEVNTIGSEYDTTLGVYAGLPGSLSLIGCNDDFYDLQSAVRFDATANTTYYVMVGFCCGNGEAGGGRLFFNVLEIPPPLDITLFINALGSFNRTGAATVGGAVTCNQPAEVDVSGQLRQKLGRRIIVGSFSTHVSCAGETPWSAIARSDQGAFGGGRAEILGGASGCDQYTCGDDQVTAIVRLRGAQ